MDDLTFWSAYGRLPSLPLEPTATTLDSSATTTTNPASSERYETLIHGVLDDPAALRQSLPCWFSRVLVLV